MTSYKIVLAGDTGTGKTFQFLTLPGRKFAYIFDPAASSTLDLNMIDHELWFPDTSDLAIIPRRGSKGFAPSLYTRWAKDFNAKSAAGFFAKYDVILVDSLTLLGQACLSEELAKNPTDERLAHRFAGETMVQAIWGLASLPCHVLLTVHTKYSADPETTKKEHRLTIPGGSKLYLPRFVSAMWFTTVVEEKGKPRYKVLTRPTQGWTHVRTPRAWAALELWHDVTVEGDPSGSGIGALINGH